MLWLCLHFPHLALEVFSPETDNPYAVSSGSERERWIYVCNTAAKALGVLPGMQLGAAHALADISILERDESMEIAALERLAAWSGQYTSIISVVPPASLLLEIAGSLHLFGGIEALCNEIRAGVAALEHQLRMASAPTPLASIWLAHTGREVHVRQRSSLAGQLANLPVAVTEPGVKALRSLTGMGVKKIGDLQRLPRDGFARRIAPELLCKLDQALGRQPDPRPHFELPPRFVSRIELPYAAQSTEALLFIGRRQLLELIGFLRARISGAQCLEWQLFHRTHKPSRLSVGLVTPSSELEHLLSLFRERLETLSLPEPVEALLLEVEDILQLSDRGRDLFAPRKTVDGEGISFIERLRARLGKEAITGLCLVSDHRPEHAWRACSPGNRSPEISFARRPLWLMKCPMRLDIVNSRPYLEGPLLLARQRERIEAGWWDGADVARDYFIARNPHGSQFWVYRELRKPGDWFLHGVFE